MQTAFTSNALLPVLDRSLPQTSAIPPPPQPPLAEYHYGVLNGPALMAAAAATATRASTAGIHVASSPWLAATQIAAGNSSPPSTSADLDDAIMETVEDDLFESGAGISSVSGRISRLSASNASASSNARRLSSLPVIPSLPCAPASALPPLHADSDRLPDRPRSYNTGHVAPAAAAAGAAPNQHVCGAGGNCRCGPGCCCCHCNAGCGGSGTGGGGHAGPGGRGGAVQQGTLARGGVVLSIEPLTLLPPTQLQPQQLQPQQPSQQQQQAKESGLGGGGGSGCCQTSTSHVQVPISVRQQHQHHMQQAQLYPGFGSNPYQPTHQDSGIQHHPACCLSGSGTYTRAMTTATTTSNGCCSASASVVHPALAHMIAAGDVGDSCRGCIAKKATQPVAAAAVTPAEAAAASTAAGAEDPPLLGAPQALMGWDLMGGPIGPVPVPISVQGQSSSARTGEGSQVLHPSSFAGSIAAAAARSSKSGNNNGSSVNGLTSGGSQPRLAATHGSATFSVAANNSHVNFQQQQQQLLQTEPWVTGAYEEDGGLVGLVSENGYREFRSGGGGAGKGRLGSFLAQTNVYDAMPDACSSTCSNRGPGDRACTTTTTAVAVSVAAAASAAAATGACDEGDVAAAVRALLRLDSGVSPFLLPQAGQQQLDVLGVQSLGHQLSSQLSQRVQQSQQRQKLAALPLPGCGSAPVGAAAAQPLNATVATSAAAAAATAPASSSAAVVDCDVAAGAFAPELPPPGPLPTLPLPASVLESLQPSGIAAVDRYLQQLLMDPSAERHVFLCKRPLSVTACTAIASCLRACPGVKSITLSYCSITCEGLASLCDGLRTCRDLLVLDLSYNLIANMGAAALAASLADMPSLASLSLVGNTELADAGAAALAAAARGSSCLRRIGLRGTSVTPPGLRELSAALGGNTRRTSAARRNSVVAAGGPPLGVGGAAERPVTWDGMTGGGGGGGGFSTSASGAADGVFIAQLCTLLRTLVRPALAAELAVAAAVNEILAAAPSPLPPASSSTAAAAVGVNGGPVSNMLSYIAEGLSRRGYDVAVTHALGGGSGGACLRNLRHTFLSVTSPATPPLPSESAPASAAALTSLHCHSGSSASCRQSGSAYTGTALATALPYHPGVIIVDPELKEQFEVAMPTARYEALVSALPRVYVGAEERLPLVVEVLCDEMALSLRSKGMVIPPWRESAAMISKWQPKQSRSLVQGTSSTSVAAGPAVGSNSSVAAVHVEATTAAVSAATVTTSASSASTTTIRAACIGTVEAADAAAAAAAVGSVGSVAPRVSLSGGIAAAAMPVRWPFVRQVANCGGGGAGSGVDSRSLGSTSGGGSSSRPDSVPLVTSFGFRQFTTAADVASTSDTGFGSVNLVASLGMGTASSESAASIAIPSSTGGGVAGGGGGLSLRFVSATAGKV
ncbi:hypothetical protein Agub_g7084 [Astrephomene gubernaculifera]|uniref:Uncharacterized protein n=1 Tax=Astrephomene gubernaculifera TaxID=47775 RepID=A0AAD3DPK2_9CHLO|nr:hypothetical protein Agub_g7084 [Astrephomene gubernaculifera]